MQKHLQIAHALQHLIGRWRNKGCIAESGAADPVLGFSKFTRCLVGAPSLVKQHTVHFLDQSQRHRKSLRQSLQPIVQGSHIIADLPVSADLLTP